MGDLVRDSVRGLITLPLAMHWLLCLRIFVCEKTIKIASKPKEE